MRIIQGGMGVGISNWRLARTVSALGGLGVVSGTALDQVLARRLQMGDPDGHLRRALDHFPVPASTSWRRFSCRTCRRSTARCSRASATC